MVTDPDFETKYPKAARQGSYEQVDIVPSYVDHLLSYIDTKEIAPLNIVANPGNGGAGPIVKELAKHLPVTLRILMTRRTDIPQSSS